MLVPPPRELDGDGGPSSPSRRVIPRAPLHFLLDERVSEMLRDVLDVLGVEAERLGGFEGGEREGGGREALHEGATETPGEKLVAAEVPGT